MEIVLPLLFAYSSHTHTHVCVRARTLEKWSLTVFSQLFLRLLLLLVTFRNGKAKTPQGPTHTAHGEMYLFDFPLLENVPHPLPFSPSLHLLFFIGVCRSRTDHLSAWKCIRAREPAISLLVERRIPIGDI